MIKLSWLLRRARFQKKSSLYKQVWLMTFDVTIMFYILVLVGYFVWAFIHEGNWTNTIKNMTFQMEAISLQLFWLLTTAVPLGLVFRTFTRPGIIISTAEYTASMLTYTKKQIWWMAAIVRWLKLAVILCFISIMLTVFSPTSGGIILSYVSLLFGINVLMTVIEWRLFQLHIIWKILVFIGLILINVVSVLTAPIVLACLMVVLLIITNVFLLQQVDKRIDWKKVTATCDYQVWNMPTLTYFTKQKMKKERSYTIWQRLPFWRKAFPYKKQSAYNRLWHVYWQRQIVIILQFSGVIILLASFVPVMNEWLVKIPLEELVGFSLTPLKNWLFFVALAIAIHMYVTVAVVLWRDRLTTDIVQVLPWDLTGFQQTFLMWLRAGTAIFIVPVVIFTYYCGSIFLLVQLVVAFYALYYLLYWKLIDAFRLVSAEEYSAVPNYAIWLGYAMLGAMIASAFVPWMIFISLLFVTLGGLFHIRNKRLVEHNNTYNRL